MMCTDIRNEKNIILKGVGGFYSLSTPFGIITAKPRGLFRERGEKPIAGDYCIIEPSEEGEGFSHIIVDILPRKNRFVRPPVANVDQLFLVASTIEPRTSSLLLDTMIAVGVYMKTDVTIIVTKTDLERADYLCDIYHTTPHRILIAGEQDDEILRLARDNITVLTGNTGVGKSTLMNRLYGTDRPTAPISKKLGRGVHTTREAELLPLDCGGFIADTAGFSSLSFSMLCNADSNQLAGLFSEFSDFAHLCRFGDCSHRKETGCAVREEVACGKIHKSRYDNYLRLYEELQQKRGVNGKT